MPATGGWVEGDAAFVGENPSSGAVVTFYQRSRHIYGPLKLEVFDAKGKLVDTLNAPKRRGLNRVSWSMQLPPPRVPRAAQVAFNASAGPRVLPGTYTLRLTKGTEVIEEKMNVGLDRRAPYKAADRKAQFDALMAAHGLFGDMSTLVDRIDGAREAADKRVKALGKDALSEKVGKLKDKLDEVKKKIVATKEGGAITGEERLREHLDIVYGALMSWEGKPGKYQVERVATLKRELDDVRKDFEELVKNEIRPLDAPLKEKKLEPIPTELPAATSAADQAQRLGEVEVHCLETRGRECAAAARDRDR
jgi:hypothetical protein